MEEKEIVEKKDNIKINAILHVIKTIAILLFPLITFPAVSIALGPENVGKVDFSNSYVSYFSLIASLGISVYAIRECSIVKNDKEKLSKTASEIFSINIITTIIAYVLLLISFFIYKKIGDYKLLITISATTLLFNTLGCDWINYACEKFLFVTIRTILFKLLFVVLVLVFVKSPEQTFWYMFINSMITNAVAFSNVFFHRKTCKIRFTFKIDWKKHMKPILVLFAMQISESILNNLDITMLGIIKDDYTVGLYGFAYKIKMMLAQLVYAIVVVFVPKCSKAYSDGDFDTYNKYIKKMYDITTHLFFPAILGAVFVSPQIVAIFGGGKFNESLDYLRILLGSLAISSIGSYFVGNLILISTKREVLYAVSSFIGVIVNVILNLILIPQMGGLAAAITTCISEFTILLVMFWKFDKRIRFKGFVATTVKPLLACAVMFVFFYFFDQLSFNFWLKLVSIVVGCAALFYLFLLLVRDEFTVNAIKFVKHKLQRKKQSVSES